jgi:dTDP-4-amino-4,6-dideoxygalactose transaminase
MTMTVPPARSYFTEDDIGQMGAFAEEIVRSGMLTSHRFVRKFEEEFARLSETRYNIAISSGTAALEIVMRSLDIGQGDEVIVPTNTFTATARAVVSVGASPVLCDIDRSTLCADHKDIVNRISPRTRALIVVHIGGLVSPQITEIKEICEDRGILLIEDAAHAHGSRIDHTPASSIGNAASFSFYATKVITDLAVLGFDHETKMMRLESIHRGVSVSQVKENTGFEIMIPREVPTTEPPTADQLKLLRSKIDQHGFYTKKWRDL